MSGIIVEICELISSSASSLLLNLDFVSVYILLKRFLPYIGWNKWHHKFHSSFANFRPMSIQKCIISIGLNFYFNLQFINISINLFFSFFYWDFECVTFLKIILDLSSFFFLNRIYWKNVLCRSDMYRDKLFFTFSWRLALLSPKIFWKLGKYSILFFKMQHAKQLQVTGVASILLHTLILVIFVYCKNLSS